MGCLVVGEPAFWMGFDRSGADSFYDYFRQLTEWEPKRCAQYGIRHYCWVGVNAKEAENVSFAREVTGHIPEFLNRPNVLGIGEIGLHKNTKREVATLEALIDLAMQTNEQMLFHTPHLADKYQGTRMILDLLRADSRVDRSRVCIDHLEEHTIRPVMEQGYWGGITLYPTTKATPQRAADMVEVYGPERLLINSSADWGPSCPTAVPDFILAMRLRGHPESIIRKLVYDNPLEFFNQSRNFQFSAPE
jgi:predicted metal-dependent TIM-barrel fold hydrolase